MPGASCPYDISCNTLVTMQASCAQAYIRTMPMGPEPPPPIKPPGAMDPPCMPMPAPGWPPIMPPGGPVSAGRGQQPKGEGVWTSHEHECSSLASTWRACHTHDTAASRYSKRRYVVCIAALHPCLVSASRTNATALHFTREHCAQNPGPSTGLLTAVGTTHLQLHRPWLEAPHTHCLLRLLLAVAAPQLWMLWA